MCLHRAINHCKALFKVIFFYAHFYILSEKHPINSRKPCMLLLVGFQRSSKDLLYNGFSFVYPIIQVFDILMYGFLQKRYYIVFLKHQVNDNLVHLILLIFTEWEVEIELLTCIYMIVRIWNVLGYLKHWI